MDTRCKIIGAARAASLVEDARGAGRDILLLTGYFDPLLAAHAERVSELRASGQDRLLMVLVRTPEEPLMPAEARAELVAALSGVDYVVVDEERSVELLHLLKPEEVIDDEAADGKRRREFMSRVRSRNAA
ncbi:MAG: hypothetical protein IRZ15_16310 [Bryobacteraceae bacterium]|nr:hypothetical protein [Bryobacteraceae bacterium]